MTHDDAVAAALEWALETCPDLSGGYDYMPSQIKELMPFVACDNTTSEITDFDPDFPLAEMQQEDIIIYRVELIFMVDATDSQSATEQIRGFADDLTAKAANDSTLGGRVPMRSKHFSFSWSPPLVEFEDGTRGRHVTMSLALADFVQIEV